MRTWYAVSNTMMAPRAAHTSAMRFHCSCVGSTPVGLCATVCSTKTCGQTRAPGAAQCMARVCCIPSFAAARPLSPRCTGRCKMVRDSVLHGGAGARLPLEIEGAMIKEASLP